MTQTALARTGLAGYEDHSGAAGLGFAQGALEARELARAADEAREASRARALEAMTDGAGPQEVEHPHRCARALDAVLATIQEVEEARGEPRGLVGDADAARWRQLLNPGGEPDHVTLGGVIHAEVVPDSPDDHLARIEPHPHREFEATLSPHVLPERPDLARHVQGGRAGALGVILVSDGGTEEGHDAVTGVLIDGSLVTVDAVREDPEQAIEEAMPFLGIDAFGELHGACHVGEEDGDRLALPLERALLSEDLLGEVARSIGTRLGGGGRGRHARAAVVAELRRRGVFVSTGWAGHRNLTHLRPEASAATAPLAGAVSYERFRSLIRRTSMHPRRAGGMFEAGAQRGHAGVPGALPGGPRHGDRPGPGASPASGA